MALKVELYYFYKLSFGKWYLVTKFFRNEMIPLTVQQQVQVRRQ
jgi:hypothetical protein